MSEPLLHVLVINWNGREHLRDCFDSLLTSHYENARFVLVGKKGTDYELRAPLQTVWRLPSGGHTATNSLLTLLHKCKQ